ncbi:LppP/LprE family lipoprotein [Actinoallomurus sp. CA-142502]|uniref:LppP/LprE family lipoprotein n=1 Tax=Actinoallomurus sp. CA-142502 TaxID=3239885 RepID=UPI003D8A74E5
MFRVSGRTRPAAVRWAALMALAAIPTGCRARPATAPAHAAAPTPTPTVTATPTATASATPDTPPASHPVTAPATGVPSRSAIRRVMARTTEVATSEGHFVLDQGPVSVADGYGGTLTAAVGQRYPTADAHGQLVFFWHDTRFLGLDSVRESDTITGLRRGTAGAFRVTYAHYAPSDAECCASLPPVTVAYRWTGSRLVASGTPPLRGTPLRIHVALIG